MNPRSWAESGDRYRDSSDLAVERAWSREQWSRYRNGDISAQELEDIWEEGLSDADRERLKEQEKQRLEDEVDKAQKELDAINQQKADLEQMINDLKSEIDTLLKQLEALREELEDCIKECKEKDLANNVPDWTLGGDIPFEYDSDPEIFSDGFESGDVSAWSTGEYDGVQRSVEEPKDEPEDTGETVTVTFGDGYVIPAGGSVDLGDMLRASDQYDEDRGVIVLDEDQFTVTLDGGLAPQKDEEPDIDLSTDTVFLDDGTGCPAPSSTLEQCQKGGCEDCVEATIVNMVEPDGSLTPVPCYRCATVYECPNEDNILDPDVCDERCTGGECLPFDYSSCESCECPPVLDEDHCASLCESGTCELLEEAPCVKCLEEDPIDAVERILEEEEEDQPGWWCRTVGWWCDDEQDQPETEPEPEVEKGARRGRTGILLWMARLVL